MALDFARARELCTQTELALVESVRPTSLRSMTPRAVRLKVRRARGLRDKFRDLAVRQAREGRVKDRAVGRARPGRSPARTKAKAELFEEVLRRFEARAAELGEAGEPAAPPPSARTRRPTKRAARSTPDRGRRLRSEAAVGVRKGRKLKTSSVPRKQSHASSRNRRGQAKRDAR